MRSIDPARMSREDILRLLFIPGFSSAKTVSDLSGRGVGLDVVKTELEKMGGRMNLITETGLGTTFEFFLQSAPVGATWYTPYLIKDFVGSAQY